MIGGLRVIDLLFLLFSFSWSLLGPVATALGIVR